MNLVNKVIVITGGTSGIGRQIVEQLHAQNKIVVIARNSDRLEQLKKGYKNVICVAADLSDPNCYKSLSERIQAEFPKIDVLINNAAIQNEPLFTDTNFEYEQIVREININFTAVCSLSYLLIPALNESGPTAAILNINSGLSFVAKKSASVYCASKAAINLFSQSLNYQLEHTNIKVLQAFIPLVDTPMTQGRGDNKISAEAAARAIIDGLKRQKSQHDIGKIKLLRVLNALTPALAKRLLKGS
ncbi:MULTISPECIES: SDR family oxidoreductase [Pseudoalteromonas]|uniref:SDR family NAD(P)-dependent oxidoreductase n=1 Tax=Pseudoalteromonas obscura TaxID=3048491 RepID=A0ABT7EEA5_9GAMM|nr:SDR family NAD(P)-dependent oxidoreductase [Pseudoalteromonas sp. P94(2023)]MBQ4838555.1 SDR family NAD(P)-dependent oxidoreductase [Pseudoalteromonas luteoviolacea]MDK2593600.1 SDR family NAD(P)-dependent oxidoreductase [Pseudoalteromonas sp. P94(2023)]